MKLGSERSARSPVFIDPELDAVRRELLAAVPGGFNSPPTIEERRTLINSFLAQNPLNENVSREDRYIASEFGAPDIRIRIYRPRSGVKLSGAIMAIHGGGLVMEVSMQMMLTLHFSVKL
ncbi:MAG: hypothetical protein WDO06_00760 [Actinomycetota bacterium]